MKAIILAAGMGNRLGEHADHRPKSLLEFDGKTLLQRHIEILLANGISEITIIIGYKGYLIEEHLGSSNANLSFINNPRFTEGSGISLGCAREIIRNEPAFILMDADVLYAPAMIERLVNSPIENCFLLDRDFIPGDEPVKLCVDDNDAIIEFRKQVAEDIEYELQGESVGFFKFSNKIGNAIVDRIDDSLGKGENDMPYEEAIRDLLLEDSSRFGYEDVTGIPWIEIDFPEDIERAKKEILAKL